MYYSVIHNVNNTDKNVLVFFDDNDLEKVLFRLQLPTSLTNEQLLEVSNAIIHYANNKEDKNNEQSRK